MGGMMSLTGEPDGEPMKVGVGIADVMCGMYGVAAILAAVHHRHKTGQGQHIDMALLDSQVGWLVNEGTNYLVSGKVPQRRGNEHPNIVPYKVLPAKDGPFILAVGNDAQFRRFCEFAGVPELSEDLRFTTNSKRIVHREELYAILPDITRRKTQQEWDEGLAALGVPAGPVNTLDKVFANPQVRARNMQIRMPYPGSETGEIDLIGCPIKMSETPVDYRRAPPTMGQHTDEVLGELLGLDDGEIDRLREAGTI
jgi:crotonobetainyl-CoA:carnitine CoA-transferase CaiB-like acyl-CoA transferase